ncbi:Protein of unknown function [Thermobacillus xylanilyticus]|uniref:Uncharacterized protein n=1 Tax=Thermobacillus xylanilyticus TaxID=76633 RepID=A0ABM8V6X6_THEXY|nr:Protein of unknown function [Thermobacillus xylanilyticus]
MNVRFYRHDG